MWDWARNIKRNIGLNRAVNKEFALIQEASVNKPLWQSKTFWVNLIGGAAGILGYLPNNKYTVAAAAGINIVLRLLTNTGVTLTGS